MVSMCSVAVLAGSQPTASRLELRRKGTDRGCKLWLMDIKS
jgi:hypothetical protein